MKKLLIVFAVLLFTSSIAYADETERTHTFHQLTGGGAASLDASISGVSVGPTDQFIGIDNSSGTTLYLFYRVVMDSAAENVPLYVRADDVGAGATSYQQIDPFISAVTQTIIISSPDNLDNLAGQQPIWVNDTNYDFVITNAKFKCSGFDTSGVLSGGTIAGISYSASETDYTFGSGTTIFNYVWMSTAGTSVYYTSITGTGTTSVPKGRSILMDYGDGTSDWLIITLGGYYDY